MPDGACLDALVSRRIAYRYRRTTLAFDLSLSLFSSAGVDSGTQVLLAALAEEIDLAGFDRVVDVGSGTGTLGISLAAGDGLALESTDRDARAVAFTERNAALNELPRVEARHALEIPPYPGEGREIVVSNLPAKAGEPVLRMLVNDITRRAALARGVVGIVIVRPLADLLASILGDQGVSVIAERRTANHTAVIYEPSVAPEPVCGTERPDPSAGPPEVFIRTTAGFQGPRNHYAATTVWNLPEFDGLSFRTALAFDLLREHKPGGAVLVYGCGQGHLAVGLLQRMSGRGSLVLADRDLLALRISAMNAKSAGGTAPERVLAVATPGNLAHEIEPGSPAWIVVDDDPVAGSRWNEEMLAVAGLLPPAGRLLVVSRSTTISRLEREAGSRLREKAQRKMHGFRASLLAPGR